MARRTDSDEAKLLPRFRLVGFFVGLFLVTVYVLGAIFQLPFLRSDFKIDPTILGVLGGITLVLGGVEGISRLAGFNITPTKKDDES
jgi:hypothetical protein